MRSWTTQHLCRGVILVLLLVCSIDASATDPPNYFNAEGYRQSHFRAPTPDSAPYGERVDTEGLRRLIAQIQPALVDVQAVPLRPETAQFGISWLPSKTRYHIPGSVWLPNVGYGVLDKAMDRYFRANLARAAGGDFERPIVFYCVVDCWMSWNAVKRAAGYGYANLYWYPDGTDGWAAHGLPLVKAEPVPLEPATDETADGSRTIGDH